MVPRFCIASHAYSRSARAPLLKFLDTLARDGCEPPISERPSLSHRAGASQPPRPRLLPAPRRLYFMYYRRLLPART
eukprot:5283724-Pleurochrysis_carterae.AAC.1